MSRVYPLNEGILIEFSIKPEIKLQEILYFQKNKNNMEVEDISLPSMQGEKGKYCYATLTRHPYNPIKILGQLSSEEVEGWLKNKEQIVWASDRVPLLISYNE